MCKPSGTPEPKPDTDAFKGYSLPQIIDLLVAEARSMPGAPVFALPAREAALRRIMDYLGTINEIGAENLAYRTHAEELAVLFGFPGFYENNGPKATLIRSVQEVARLKANVQRLKDVTDALDDSF